MQGEKRLIRWEMWKIPQNAVSEGIRLVIGRLQKEKRLTACSILHRFSSSVATREDIGNTNSTVVPLPNSL